MRLLLVGEDNRTFVDDFENYIKDLEKFYQEVVSKESKPVHIVTNSMGTAITIGFIARAEPNKHSKIKQIVLMAPMFKLPSAGILENLYWAHRPFGTDENYVNIASQINQGPYQQLVACNKPDFIKTDSILACALDSLYTQKPETRDDGFTWDWLNRVLRFTKTIPDFVNAVDKNILLMAGLNDTRVDIPFAINLCKGDPNNQTSPRFPHCKVSEFPDRGHDLIFELDQKDEVFRQIHAFLLEGREKDQKSGCSASGSPEGLAPFAVLMIGLFWIKRPRRRS